MGEDIDAVGLKEFCVRRRGAHNLHAFVIMAVSLRIPQNLETVWANWVWTWFSPNLTFIYDTTM